MDGSDMAPPPTGPTKWDRAASVGHWFKHDFAEWVVGSWAKIIAWAIVGIIFFSFLQMDGYFSRGLGEGSGVDPDLFMHIGWAFRLFAAVFLVLAVKFTVAGMKEESRKLKWLGTFCTIIVIAHAMGFGLKALEGKRTNAMAVSEVAATVTQSSEQVIVTLTAQKEAIRADLDKQTAPLKAEITQYIVDGKNNDDLANSTRARRTELEDKAQVKIDAIDAEILKVTTASGEHAAASTEKIVTTEKWAPLFVGLAQLFTWNPNPDDWAIYVAGVLFLMFWILLGDAICIFVPPALYKLHLKDAKPKDVRVSADVFADLQAQADELAKRKAKLGEGAEKGIKTKTKNKKVRLAIEDMRAEIVKREEILKAAEAEDAASETEELEPTDEAPVEDEQPAEVEAENDDTDKQEKAA